MNKTLSKIIICVVAFAFVAMDFGIIYFFQSLLRNMFDIPYSKQLYSMSFIILISFGLGIVAVFVLQYVYKRLVKTRKND